MATTPIEHHHSPDCPDSQEITEKLGIDTSLLGVERFEDIYCANSSFAKSTRDPNDFIVFSDFQLHREPRHLSKIDSAWMDRIIGVAKWSSAEVLNTPLLILEMHRRIEEEFPDRQLVNVGDDYDVSTQDEADILSLIYKLLGIHAPPSPPNNHSGGDHGNGLDQLRNPQELTQLIGRHKRVIHRLKKQAARKNKTVNQQLIQYHETKIAELTEELNTALRLNYQLVFDGKKIVLLPKNLVNFFYSVPKSQRLGDNHNAWAAAAGYDEDGNPRIVEKREWIANYLIDRYHIEADPQTWNLEPIATQIELYDPKQDEIRVEGGIMTKLDAFTSPEQRTIDFKTFWKEIAPGEFVCLIDFPDRTAANDNQRTIFLQASYMGKDENGNRVFNIFLDGMDHTQEEANIAFFGVFSKLQRELCELFVDHITNTYQTEETSPQFYHTSHYPFSSLSKSFWKKYGWDEYSKKTGVNLFGHIHETSVKKGPGDSMGITSPASTKYNAIMRVEIEKEKSGTLKGKVSYTKIVRPLEELEPDPERRAILEEALSQPEIEDSVSRHGYRKYILKKFSPFAGLTAKGERAVIVHQGIPMSIGQVYEYLCILSATRKLIQKEIEMNESTREYQIKLSNSYAEYTRVYNGLLEHYNNFMNGDNSADPDSCEYQGYLALRKKYDEAPLFHAKERQEIEEELLLFDDIYDTNYVDEAMRLPLTLPRESLAYKFALTLGKRGAENEIGPKKFKSSIHDRSIL